MLTKYCGKKDVGQGRRINNKLAKSKPCTGCGDPIHFDQKDHEISGKWRPFNEDNEPHYCDANKISSVDVSSITVPPRSERGDVTLSQKEWTNLREQIVAIQMQMSEIWQEMHTLRILCEKVILKEKQSPSTNSLEDQIDNIDFDQMFNDNNPS